MEPIHHQLPAERIEELVAEVQNGLSEHYRPLIQHFQRRIHIYCFHMLGGSSETEDAVQEVFLRAYTSITAYKQTISFSAWLYRIAHNHCLNLIKQRKRRVQLVNLLSRLPFQESSADPAALVEDILEQLPVFERQLLILKIIEERSFAEIAEVTGLKEATLRKQFERLRKRIVFDWNRKGLQDDKQVICPES